MTYNLTYPCIGIQHVWCCDTIKTKHMTITKFVTRFRFMVKSAYFTAPIPTVRATSSKNEVGCVAPSLSSSTTILDCISSPAIQTASSSRSLSLSLIIDKSKAVLNSSADNRSTEPLPSLPNPHSSRLPPPPSHLVLIDVDLEKVDCWIRLAAVDGAVTYTQPH